MVFPLKCRGYYTVEQVLAAQEKGMSLQLPGGSNHCESAYNEMEKKPIIAKPKAKFVFGKNQKKEKNWTNLSCFSPEMKFQE